MTRHDDMLRLRHMLDYAREAVALVQNKERAELDHNRLLELALVRLMEIVGEAANQVSAGGQAMCPAIPWRMVVGMRNRLVHGYDQVDLDVLWNTITEDLPPLIAALEKIMPNG